ncbi:hypothetical protein ABPG74_001505 [Tetrahymena malaccensis]
MSNPNKNFQQQREDNQNQNESQNYKIDDSQVDMDNTLAQVIKGLELEAYQDMDLNSSQNNPAAFKQRDQLQAGFPVSSKSQQNQSFVMNNSILHLNNADNNEERSSLNSGKFKNQYSAKTNVYSNNTSLILNGSIIDDKSIKSPKKNNIGKEIHEDQSYEINIGQQLREVGNEQNNYRNQLNDPQSQLKSVLKKPAQLPPITRQPKSQGSSQRSSLQFQDMQMNNISNNNSNQNSVILKGKGNEKNSIIAAELDHQQIALDMTQKDQQSLSNSQVSNKSKQINQGQNAKRKKLKRCIDVLFPKCKLRSTVTALCILFIVFFLIQLILESTTSQKRACTAYKIGCQFQPSVTNEGQVHRLLISSLLSASWFNIISSIFSLLFYGYVLETHYGVAKMLWLYGVCAFSGNIFVGLIEPYEIQIGANSIMMGIFILQITFLYTIRKRIPKSKKKPILGMLLLVIVTNFLCIIESVTVKGSSYLGGIVAGVFLSFGFYKAQNPSKRFVYAQKASFVVLALIELSVFIVAMTYKLDDIQIAGLDRCQA